MQDIISFEQFEKLYTTARSLIDVSGKMFELSEGMIPIPFRIYSEVIRMHNASVDFIKAYTEMMKEKEEN